MSLLDRLRADIAQSGPISVAEYMLRCLHDPQGGYYATRPALGAGGDFITAPLVSQMFGELIGLWCVETWVRLGRPAPFHLVEIGPGDGTLMSDVLRAAKLALDFLAAADLWLVETSAPLRALQAAKLGDAAQWADQLDAVPGDAPLIVIANELLDCLPARQFVRTDKGWAERMVGLDADGALTFGLRALESPPSQSGGGGAMRQHRDGGGVPSTQSAPSVSAAPIHLPRFAGEDVPVGAILEQSPAQEAFAHDMAERVARDGGAALLIDYGAAEPGVGDTLQALKGHQKVDPLACPGEADLTVHADFPAVAQAAREAGAQAAPILTQGEFLRRLGVEQRAAALAAARPDRSETLARQLHRLTDPAQMGDLFKVLCVHSAGLVPPAFEEPAA